MGHVTRRENRPLRTASGSTTCKWCLNPARWPWSALRYCSQARFRLSVGGVQEQLSGWLGASQATPAFAFAKNSGTYQVRVRAEGRPGGCNKGWLTFWNGTLKVTVTPR